MSPRAFLPNKWNGQHKNKLETIEEIAEWADSFDWVLDSEGILKGEKKK